MLNLIRLSLLVLFIFSNPAMATSACETSLIFSTDNKTLIDCAKEHDKKISLQSLEISTLQTQISTLKLQLESLKK